MVLQRDRPCPVWGRAEAGELVTVTFRDEKIQTTADALGRWQVTLRPTPAGGPYTLQISGRNSITISDILAGEVWLASGQSNMGWTVDRSNNAAQEIASSTNPNIRFFKVENTVAAAPADDVKGAWSSASPATTGAYSAVGTSSPATFTRSSTSRSLFFSRPGAERRQRVGSAPQRSPPTRR